jgi:hypothetical protein
MEGRMELAKLMWRVWRAGAARRALLRAWKLLWVWRALGKML